MFMCMHIQVCTGAYLNEYMGSPEDKLGCHSSKIIQLFKNSILGLERWPRG